MFVHHWLINQARLGGRVLLAVVLAHAPWLAHAQDQRIYRCGNEYTNKKSDTVGKNCKVVEGGNLTIVQSPRSAPSGGTETKPVAVGAVDKSSEQKARDSDARAILEDELRKSEQKLVEIQKEYNNGKPDKIGIEASNYQRYLDRVEDMKANIARTESDIAGLKRELARLR
jgi:hypothetical protein